MKHIFILLFLLQPAFPAFAQEKQQLVDRVVAVVNQEIITQSELDAIFQPVYMQFRDTYQGRELAEKLEDAHKKMLNQLIEDKLVLQQAKKLGVEVTEQEVEERFAEFRKQFSETDFQAMMKAQGVREKTLRDRLRDQIAIQKLHYVEIQRKTIVSPLEIKKYYEDHPNDFLEKEKVKVWVIAIPKSEEAVRKGARDETARKKAEALFKELKKGKDFSELAKAESRDSHAQEGGLIGYVGRGDMIEKVDQSLFALSENQFTNVIETEQAYHIFKVGDRKSGRTLSLEEARDAIHNLLYRQKANERFESWMEELKKSAYISVR